MPKKDFYFLGRGPFSKSLLNRAWIVKSWFPDFSIQGDSSCDDILIMKKAARDLKGAKKIYCGLSGTAFRFLALRLSREEGEFLLTGAPALWARPMEGLSSLLSQLSVSARAEGNGFLISSEGWKLQGDALYVPSKITSQYSSALVLNSWNLDKDLYFSLGKNPASYPYFQMTLDFAKSLGLIVREKGSEFFIPKGQSLKKWAYAPERDKSCLFALACFAVLNGQAVFLDWEEDSLQPDNIFPKFLQEMGAPISLKNKQLIVSQSAGLKPLSANLKGAPDLLPLLAVLCAKAEGQSRLRGLAGAAFKESDRLRKTKELLNFCGVLADIQEDELIISGAKTWPKAAPYVFSAENDHRMAMAGELASSLGAPITVKGKGAVNKSFPEFYSCIGSARPPAGA